MKTRIHTFKLRAMTMQNDEQKAVSRKAELASPLRRRAIQLFGVGLIMPLAACGYEEGAMEMKNGAVLNVQMYSNLDRPVHDIIFNGTGLGVMNSYGGTGTITDVQIPFGIQTLQWTLGGPEGLARNGEVVRVKNLLVISADEIPPLTRYIGLHLYPDDTAEVTFDEFIPERTERGKIIRSIWKASIAENLSISSKSEGGKK